MRIFFQTIYAVNSKRNKKMTDVHHIKLVNRNAKTNRPVYAKTKDSWWTFNIYMRPSPIGKYIYQH